MASKVSIQSRCAGMVFLSFLLLGMAASPPLVGGPAPSFQLETVDGQMMKMSGLKGQYVVLNFWATWCVPCIKELPELQKAHQSLSPDVKIIGINLAESRERVEEYLEGHALNFPVLLDGYGKVSQEYQVLNLPVTYFITPDGIIRDKVFGGGITQEMIEAKIHQLS